MHLQALLPLLLAASASALPGNVIRAETPSSSATPSPTSEPPATTTEVPTTTSSEPEPTETELTPEEKCELPFNEEDLAVVQDTWEKSGAGTFLYDFLTENGVEDWVGNLFQETVGDGNQGGSTYDCTNFPAEGSCTSPGHQLCLEYTPEEMFYVHLSIANLYSAFVTIHEDMQDSMITNLASEIKKVVEIFGPPPPDNPFIFALLIGAFVGAAALAGPVWMIGAPMTGIVGGLNIASGIQASEEEPTPMDWENELESSLGDFYSGFSDTLESTIQAIFGGNFDGLEGFDSDPVDFIVEQFDGGKMLDYKLVDPAIDAWSDAVSKMIVRLLPRHPLSNKTSTDQLQGARTRYSIYDGRGALRLARCKFQSTLPSWV